MNMTFLKFSRIFKIDKFCFNENLFAFYLLFYFYSLIYCIVYFIIIIVFNSMNSSNTVFKLPLFLLHLILIIF